MHSPETRELAELDQAIQRGIEDLDADTSPPVIQVSSLPNRRQRIRNVWDDGTKYPGGYGPTSILLVDYWTLRMRSAELFEKNLYARGLIRRLVTNEINTGLHLEATPEESVLGFPEDGLSDWSETVENRFGLWAKSARLCDHKEQRTFGGLQADARMEALVTGDVLVVLRQDQRTKLPRVQLISGSSVRTPLFARPRRGNKIRHGVELDASDRQVAYWVVQGDTNARGKAKRLPAFGERSGRRIAWLLYGTDKRLDRVRGKPILSLVLQSLKEIDRYRDSTQRKAVLNSMLAMFIRKTDERMGTLPITGGAVRRDTVIATDQTDPAETRTYNTAELIPGLVLDELQVGEEPVAFTTNGTLEQLGTFEAAIIGAVAWANEMPPEILMLAFSNNYSASQAAINEFKIYLNKVRTSFGEELCQPVYVEWLLAETLAQRVDAARLFEARGENSLFDVFAAWTSADWSGHIKPSTDIWKQARGYEKMINLGLITRDRAARELTGTKFSKNVKKLRRENEALAEANATLDAEEADPVGTLELIESDTDEEERAAG